jgi:hypothetical protein
MGPGSGAPSLVPDVHYITSVCRQHAARCHVRQTLASVYFCNSLVRYSIAAVVLIAVPAAFARLMLSMSAGAQHWLHKYDSSVAGAAEANRGLLQQPLCI